MTDQKHDAQEWFDQQQPDLQKFITHALTAYPGYGLAGFAEVPDGWDDTLPADRIDFLSTPAVDPEPADRVAEPA